MVETISPTETLPVKTPEIGTQTPDPSPELCQLGLGLRQQTISILGSYQEYPGFIMTATVSMAEEYYPQLDGWNTVLGDYISLQGYTAAYNLNDRYFIEL